MSNVLTQAFVYLLLLGVGYGFKRAGIFRVEDSAFLKSVILYITMPATAVNGLKDLELQPSFLWCFLTGFVTCTVLMAAGLAVVLLTLGVQGPGYDALGIEKDSLTESVSIPLQQMAATICADRPLTEEQSDFLYALIPEKTWKENYSPCLSDDLKTSLDPDLLQENFGQFLTVWAQLLPANLDVYVEAYLMQTTGFWMPGSWRGWYYEYYTGVDDVFDRGIRSVDWFAQLTGHGVQDILESFTRFVSSGTMVWVFLACFFFCLAKPKGRRKADLLMLTPFLFSWLTLMISTPIAQSYRYLLMLPLALPLFCVTFVHDRQLSDRA